MFILFPWWLCAFVVVLAVAAVFAIHNNNNVNWTVDLKSNETQKETHSWKSTTAIGIGNKKDWTDCCVTHTVSAVEFAKNENETLDAKIKERN